MDVTIMTKDIWEDFDLKEESDLDVTSHAFDQKKFWDEVKKDEVAKYVKFGGKIKDLLKPEWERVIDIVYKSLERKVAGVDEITHEKMTVLSAIMNHYNCDWARNVFNYLGTFILKAIKLGSGIISANVGHDFLIVKLLRRKGVQLGEGAEIYQNAYLFRHAIKGTGKRA